MQGVPFQALVLIKILSGKHKGAELRLTTGEYTLGRSIDSDIVISDDSVADSQFELNFDVAIFSLKNLAENSEVFINGQLCSDEEYTLKAYDVIAVGDFAFAAGQADQEWPEISIPEPQRPEIDNKESSDEGKDEEAEIEQVSSKSKRKIAINITIGCILLILSIGFFEIFSTQESQHKVSNEPTLQTLLTSDPKWKGLIVKEVNQKSVVVGYVEREEDYRSLQRLSLQQRKPVSLDVKINSQLLQNIRYLLGATDNHGIKVTRGDELGDFILHGYIGDQAEAKRLLLKLKRDIKGVKNIHAKFETLEQRTTWLKEQLETLGLEGNRILPEEGKIMIQSEGVAIARVDRIALLKLYRKEYNTPPELGFSVVPLSKDALGIRGVSLGRVPYIITKEGLKITEGGWLNTDFIVESISLDKVTLKKGDELITINMRSQNDRKSVSDQFAAEDSPR